MFAHGTRSSLKYTCTESTTTVLVGGMKELYPLRIRSCVYVLGLLEEQPFLDSCLRRNDGQTGTIIHVMHATAGIQRFVRKRGLNPSE
jgi:hypothetical protein